MAGWGEAREPERRSGCNAACIARRAAGIELADAARAFLANGLGEGRRSALVDALAMADRADRLERAERVTERVHEHFDAVFGGGTASGVATALAGTNAAVRG